MSQVIPNHVLRVGQTVCMASKDDGGVFRQGGHPRGITVTNKCSYFTTERYAGQGPLQYNGHILSHPGIYSGERNLPSNSIPTIVGNMNYSPQSDHKNQQRSGPEPEVYNGEDPMSPSLDISIEHLNQLILQLDPTFQPLTVKDDQMRKNSTYEASRVPEATKKKSSPEIKCVEVDVKRAVCQENIQQTSSPIPKHEGLLISRGTTMDNCTPNFSPIVAESRPCVRGPQTFQRRPSTGYCQQATQSIPIVYQRSYQHDTIMSSSLESETMQHSRPLFRDSETSMISTSPGSDTSYLLGSTHSLPQDEFDGPSLHGRTLESPCGSVGSFSNIMSPGLMSPTTTIFNSNSCLPKIPNQKIYTTKGNANSCPPSVNSSSMDIPILLVNGCLEREDSLKKSSRTLQRKSSSSFNRPNKTCSESSIHNCTDNSAKDTQPGMKFVMDTSKQWFKPNMNREQAIEFLKDKEPGAFIIRDSTSYRGSFGLAMKVPGMTAKTGKGTNDLVRHFLIESSAKGVHLKGACEEPHFGSLSALVYQHSITPLSLPCKLVISDKDQSEGDSSPDSPQVPTLSDLKTSSSCNVLYLNSVSTETLTGSSAVQKAVSTTFEMSNQSMPTIVHFKATDQGVTLTDVQRKVFFRRHYPLSTITFCSVDPELRKWQKQCRSSRLFGFVAKNPTDASDNVCHIFAEYDAIQPASPLISFLTNLIQQQEKV
ncbi:tensin-4 [Xenopus laevis]|uniref:SH2 domain-containing protein n=2 Tax=Xenopus laevis TaxID=8355 RepID=A0A974BWE5_XENLA|nr:tensin-4 [Xenopus laevis]OCT62050.1 hypothetical protein XELAEV_18043134mg [Xenopus laevis]